MTLDKQNCPRCGNFSYMFGNENQCWDCNEKDKIKELSKEVKRDGKSSYEKYIMCPYCGCNYGEDEMHESQDVTCDECGETFILEVDYDVTYSTNKKGESKNE